MTFDAAPAAPQWMTANGGDLDARFEFMVGGKTWTDFSSRVFQDTTNSQRGTPNESTTASTAQFAGKLDNKDGLLSYLNPGSQYYQQLGLNTPMRMSVPDASAHIRLENDQVSGVKTASKPAFMPAGDFEVWVDYSLDNWCQVQPLATKWAATGNNRSWALILNGTGAVDFLVSTGGSSYAAFASAPLPVSHGRISIRMSYAEATGTCTFYTGQYCANWVFLSSGTLGAATQVFQSSTAPLEAGFTADINADFSATTGCNGKLYAFAMIPSVGGAVATAVASWDATSLSGTSFADLQANSWTAVGNPEISSRNYRFHGESSAWPQAWTPGDPNAVVNLSGGGLLRRLGSANQAVNSPMYRAITRLTGNFAPQAYWPMEDLAGATQLASAVGSPPILFQQGTPGLAGFSGFPGSAPLVTLKNSALYTTIPGYYTQQTAGPGADACFRFLMAVPAAGDANLGVIARVWYRQPSAVGHIDLIYGTGGGLTATAYDQSNTILWTQGPVSFGVNGELLMVGMDLRNIGSSQYTFSINTVQAGANVGLISTTAAQGGAVGSIWKIQFSPDLLLNGTAIGHAFVQTTWESLFTFGAPVNGYQGEASGIRFQRLCGEEGVTFRGIGNISDTVPMGTQGLATFTSLLQECVDADQGQWLELRQVLGWGFRTRVSMGNQTAQVALDYALDHLTNELVPTIDDQLIKNDWTVTNTDGSSSRAVLADGSARSVNKTGGPGRYDTSVSVNLWQDSQLDDAAGFRLHLGTVDEPRYKAISVDLANQSLAALYWQILDAELGDLITVADPPVWLPPGLISQVVMSIAETVSRKALAFDWNTRPASPWNFGMMDVPAWDVVDTDGSTLTNAITGTQTSFQVSANPGPAWTTNGADLPINIGCGGEEMRVTAIAAGTNWLNGDDSTFDATIGDWQAGNAATASVTRVTTPVHSGAGAAQIAAVVGGGNLVARCFSLTQGQSGLPCLPGDTLTLTAWVRAATTGRTVIAGIIPFDINGVQLSTGFFPGAGTADVTTGYTSVSNAITAPAGCYWALPAVEIVSAGASELHYFDDVTFVNTTQGTPQLFTVIRSVNGAVKAHNAGDDIRLWTPAILSM